MECSVCYSAVSNCNLVCGHSFCMSCVKQWYQKGEQKATCPMCRKNLYFRGMPIKKWNDEWFENAVNTILENAMDEILVEKEWPSFVRMGVARDLQTTFHAIKDEIGSVDELDWIINDAGLYYSGRTKFKGDYEPTRGKIYRKNNRVGRRVSRW